MKWEEAAPPAAAAAALLFIDAQYMVEFVRSGIIDPAVGFVTFVFLLQVAKTVVIFVFRDLRNAKAAILVDIYGAELLLLPALLVGYLFFDVAVMQRLSDQMLQGWLTGAAFGALPLVAYRVVRGMLKGARLTEVLPTGIVSTELGILLHDGVVSATRAHTGLKGVLDFTLTGNGGRLAASPETFVAAATVYISLLLYALVGRNLDPPPDLTKALALGGGATLLAAAWVVALSSSSLAMEVVFVPPTLGMATVTWWMTHGK